MYTVSGHVMSCDLLKGQLAQCLVIACIKSLEVLSNPLSLSIFPDALCV